MNPGAPVPSPVPHRLRLVEILCDRMSGCSGLASLDPREPDLPPIQERQGWDHAD